MVALNTQKTIKIPNNVSVYYNLKENILFIKSVSKKKILKLKLKVKISDCGKEMVVHTPLQAPTKKIPKILKSLKGTTTAFIKKSFLEVSVNFYKKLNVVGVGYKVFIVQLGDLQVLHLKLGYSHSIYIKVPNNVSVNSSKFNALFISSSDFVKVTEFASLIRNCKIPEPYKGKGISFDNEIINLKVGKVI